MGLGDPSDSVEAAWLEPLYSSTQMQALDRWAIEQRGIPSLELMEEAGAGVAAVVADLEPSGPVRAVCGKGNNGGDGFVVVRLLRERGFEAEALALWPPGELSPDARAHHERLVSDGGGVRQVDAGGLAAALEGSEVIVDALLGTGFSGAARSPLDTAIEALNETGATVVAVDVPSGVDASTGEVEGACVRADVTVTFHASKPGLWIMPGKSFAGRVEVVDIGIPEGGPASFDTALIRPAVLGLVPRRGVDSTKFSSGSVLAVGGSTGLTGALCLACDASMRAGAGWVRAAGPASLNPVLEEKLTEVMSVPLADSGGHLQLAAAAEVLEAAGRADAVVLGPGLGREQQSLELARRLVSELEPPLLVDADGLFAFGEGRVEQLKGADETVLTPHAGELARLLEVESSQVSAHRLASAKRAAERSGATVVLKGDDTLVARDGGSFVAVNPSGSRALATAGTGDVLSGVIGAFLAKGLPAFEAACAGVFVHAQAGWIAAGEHGADSVIASDVIDALPAALQRPSQAAGEA
jgi:ADP-dependent NAD(P)H-hydrate dehydratase / NAD(P)H-hydrate epimerase